VAVTGIGLRQVRRNRAAAVRIRAATGVDHLPDRSWTCGNPLCDLLLTTTDTRAAVIGRRVMADRTERRATERRAIVRRVALPATVHHAVHPVTAAATEALPAEADITQVVVDARPAVAVAGTPAAAIPAEAIVNKLGDAAKQVSEGSSKLL
jgi:hypothetical protein